ncbi:hypothetical protein A4H97_31180 [Niastella yeongjuensis]|uniref:Autotransporter domain-containing protein n=1 Tax=Niastella yeongjuensis TaxID=354355 RepID=A0A1V9EJB8_9BACT|nr:hypothetical protein [Niastella yeongjuensis]OQP46227.1 hypothetical protein A4H97_31180 [Niastella yeongjuensis]SEP45988.1 hypothetical protein SAMN05660816_06392 [Niastella yeongjuensis]
MKKILLLIPFLCLSLLFCNSSQAQEKEPVVDKIINFPTTFFSKVQSKYSSLEDRLTKQTEKYLERLKKKEKKMKRKLAKTDSAKAEQTFGNIDEQYDKMIAGINKDSLPVKRGSGTYMPMVDSVKTSLAFLQQNSGVLSQSKEVQDKVKGSLSQVNELQGKLQQADQVKAFIQQRKQQIKGSLSQITNLPKGLTDEFAGFQKEAYYYSAQLKEYKDMLNDPDKMVQKGLSLLNKLPAFSSFMKQNSELASLFRLPDNYGTPQSLAGLQTRSQVQQQIQNQIASGGPNAQQMVQQNLQAAQSQLNTLKDKLNKLGGSGSGDMEIPDFKPNNQRTKSFWQRLEYGTNLQTAKNNFFPVTTDVGLSVGYKLNDKNTIGVGASYKMGWGQDIKHIKITNQGMGLRSYIDVKLKGSFYLSGGLEYNYQPIGSDSLNTNTVMHWNEISSWSKSGLIGISKIVSVKSKFFKKTKLQLLFDFLSYQQVPRTQPIKFRVGYNF